MCLSELKHELKQRSKVTEKSCCCHRWNGSRDLCGPKVYTRVTPHLKKLLIWLYRSPQAGAKLVMKPRDKASPILGLMVNVNSLWICFLPIVTDSHNVLKYSKYAFTIFVSRSYACEHWCDQIFASKGWGWCGGCLIDNMFAQEEKFQLVSWHIPLLCVCFGSTSHISEMPQ